MNFPSVVDGVCGAGATGIESTVALPSAQPALEDGSSQDDGPTSHRDPARRRNSGAATSPGTRAHLPLDSRHGCAPPRRLDERRALESVRSRRSGTRRRLALLHPQASATGAGVPDPVEPAPPQRALEHSARASHQEWRVAARRGQRLQGRDEPQGCTAARRARPTSGIGRGARRRDRRRHHRLRAGCHRGGGRPGLRAAHQPGSGPLAGSRR